MLLSRRGMIAGAAVLGGGVLVAARLKQSYAADRQTLRIPLLIDTRKQAGPTWLRAGVGSTEFFPGRASQTLGYNGGYLGPTLRVHRGDDVHLAVTNALAEDTTVHWHGLLVSSEVDGGPHQLIRPGTTWRPTLSVRQPAATLFYHPHVHGRTAEQVYSGLAGVLIVTDDEEQALRLPSDYGVDDLPLVLQDRQFEDGRMVLPQGMMVVLQGRRGDTLLVNGTPNAVARVSAGLVRLRLVNGSNARIFDLTFGDGPAFHWIASEGGLLEVPVVLRFLTLAPGERAEILVDFSDGAPVALRTAADSNIPMMMGMMERQTSAAGIIGSHDDLLHFEPGPPNRRSIAVPDRLVRRKPKPVANIARRRQFTLDMGMGMGMGGGQEGGGMAGGINGQPFDMKRVDERVRLGDSEIWEVSGEMMAHPFHIHGVQFEVRSRNGTRPLIRDQGYKDTVLVKEPVELLVHFTQPAVNAPFMYHCHILEHEDGGMMGQFLTT